MAVIMLLGTAAVIFLTAWFCGLEMSLYRASDMRMRVLAESGVSSAARVREMLKNMPLMMTSILIGINLVSYLATYIMTEYLSYVGIHQTELVSTLVLTPLFFILAETLPKQFACNIPDRWALSSARAGEWWMRLCYPLSRIFNGLSNMVKRVLTRKGDPTLEMTERTKFLEYMEAGVAENVLSTEQHSMARRVLELDALTVLHLMTPLGKSLLLSAHMPYNEAARSIKNSGHDSAVILGDNGQPNGQIVTLNLLVRNASGQETEIGELARKLGTLPYNTPILHALHWFRTEYTHQAFVVDKFDKPVGLVSVQTLLQRIVSA